MSPNDYVKFMTQQIVSYIDKPKEMRKETRLQRKTERTPFVNHWFGVIPYGFQLFFKKSKSKKKRVTK
ncbi:YqzE family protein [Cytobacillus sp. S13-E01]|uniref:YqzE family protein n=1 Tax=Cytobacillus sp. S13-E01 TaxID=3031326 RepID=UPI0023D88E38|nr:YqzE family protein [Cytobacillus sp. S13-E01]MDF0727784.1 YqzE family protein [Cytobacillus sp. S13-E01]